MTRPTYVKVHAGPRNGHREYGIDLQRTSRERVQTMIDVAKASHDPESGWATINLVETDILMGAQRSDGKGSATATYLRDWQRAGWVETRREDPHSKTIDARWTRKGWNAFKTLGFEPPLWRPPVAFEEPEVVAPTVVATTPTESFPFENFPFARALLLELGDLIKAATSPMVTCEHGAELAELDALRQWRDTVLATKP